MPGPLARRASDATVRVFLARKPVFGPSRYTLYTAPAYLILVAQGLARLPLLTRACVAVALALLIVLELGATVYAPGLKADWRAFSTELAARMARSPGTEVTVFVKSSDPVRNKEIQTARYYLPGRAGIVPPGGRGSRQTRERAKQRSLRGSRDQGGSRQVALGGRVPNPQHECVRGAHGLPGCRSPPRAPLGFSKIGSIRALRS